MTRMAGGNLSMARVRNGLASLEPEIILAYELNNDEDRAAIDLQAKRLVNMIYQLGPRGAYELLYKLGRFLNARRVKA